MVRELTSADSQRLIHQHQAMQREVDEWREWWHELDEWGDPRFEEMGVRLARFRDELADHFRLEEESGFFKQMLERQPDRRKDIARVRDQHPRLLAALQKLVDALTPSEVSYETWGAARKDFETFLDDLHAHEAAERELEVK
jgi:iron-sulfur cluster repair protein YtfE (RIC family)